MSRSRVEYLVGRKIRTASTNAGMTLCALGQKLGVSRPTIYAYATGALHVPESRIKEIARVTGQNVDFFSVQDEDEVVDLSEQLRLIDATLSPPDPRTASKLALAVIESRSEHDDPATMAQLAFRAGNALLQHGDYFDAIQQLEHARKTYLNLGQIRQAASCSQSIGYCYINLGKIDKAKESFEYSRNYSTSDQKWLGTVSLAALSERIGDFDQLSLNSIV